VTATDAGAQALAMAGTDTPPEAAGADTADAFMVNGTTSGGLGAASDEQQIRMQMAGRGGGFGGAGGGPGGGLMTLGASLGANGVDPFGMGGFGAAGADAGFGLDAGGGFGLGGGWIAKALSTRFLVYMGKASYAMYILHIPMLWWAVTWGFRFAAEIYVLLVMIVSAIVYGLIEEPANRYLRGKA